MFKGTPCLYSKVDYISIATKCGMVGEPNENPHGNMMGTHWEQRENQKIPLPHLGIKLTIWEAAFVDNIFPKELLDCWSESEMISFALKKSWFTNSVVKLNFQVPNFEAFLEMLPNRKKCMYIVSFCTNLLSTANHLLQLSNSV
jgi:hypothetical protein